MREKFSACQDTRSASTHIPEIDCTDVTRLSAKNMSVSAKKIIRKYDFREGWVEEWEAATAVIREEIEVEKLIRECWDKAVKPFRHRSWMWKEKRC